jgi:hypothetical protein
MRGHLILIAGGASVAVGALAFAATAAYAAPVPTSSSAVAHSLALVVPPNYHPVASTEQPTSPSGNGVVRVAPEAAVDIDDGTTSHVTIPSSSPSGTPVDTGGESTGAVPPASSTPPASTGTGSSGDESGSNNGNDVKNKGDGSNKSGSNNGNDVKNKGKGSNKSGSNNGNDVKNKGKGKSNG